ncbi:MAG: GTPase HflX [Simkaniaceae bacterium]|nr:GTPase HflX [Simkaniaceae bacterium]
MTEDKLYEDTKYTLKDLKRVIVVGVYFEKSALPTCQEHLLELEELANTYGFEVIERIPVHIRKFDAGTFITKGKLEELVERSSERGADVVIFDDEITPNQQRNIEKALKRPVIDRTELILEVFAQRAQTKEAMLQIELAKIRYQLPRLKRLWTHLSRQRVSGKGYLKGEGEKQIEIDRRLLRKRITALEKELSEVRAVRQTQRQARMRSDLPTFAIVGYTNAGKSTLLNSLTQAGVLEEDKLFATLDTTTRKFHLPNHQSILLIDTVGFIRKLPHGLVAAFKSTLEEVCYTDVLLHVLDVSDPAAIEHAQATREVLKELGADDYPMITLLNKIDLLESQHLLTRFRVEFPNTVAISAKTREGFDQLMETLEEQIRKMRTLVSLRIPQSEYRLVAELRECGKVTECDYEENDILLTVEIPSTLKHKVIQYEVATR